MNKLTKFEEGKHYRWVGSKSRPEYFNSERLMDFMLDGKPHLCVNAESTTYPGRYRAAFAGSSDSITWSWELKDFELAERETEEPLEDDGTKFIVGKTYTYIGANPGVEASLYQMRDGKPRKCISVIRSWIHFEGCNEYGSPPGVEYHRNDFKEYTEGISIAEPLFGKFREMQWDFDVTNETAKSITGKIKFT
jgi:hypothetical protein